MFSVRFSNFPSLFKMKLKRKSSRVKISSYFWWSFNPQSWIANGLSGWSIFPSYMSTALCQKSFPMWKVSKYGVISIPYIPVLGLNTEIYSINLCIQSEYRKIRTRNNSVFGHFSSSDFNVWGPRHTHSTFKKIGLSLV